MTIHLQLTTAQLAELQTYMAQPDADLPAERLRIIEYAAQGIRVQEISSLVHLAQPNVNKWIRRYQAHGIAGLQNGKSTGRPPLFDEQKRDEIKRIYQTAPAELGRRCKRWSLARLRTYLIERGIVEHISTETIRHLIAETE